MGLRRRFVWVGILAAAWGCTGSDEASSFDSDDAGDTGGSGNLDVAAPDTDEAPDAALPDVPQELDTVADVPDPEPDADVVDPGPDVTPEPWTLERLCTELAADSCDVLTACDCRAEEWLFYADRDACLASRYESCFGLFDGPIVDAVAAGDLVVSDVQVERCLERRRATLEDCTWPNRLYDPACLVLYGSPVPLGATCTWDPMTPCAGEAGICSAEGVCVQRGAVGAACIDLNTCELGLACVAGACQTMPGAGEPCGAQGECAGELLCLGGICGGGTPAGETCDISGSCAQGTSCQNDVCTPEPLTGQPCDGLDGCGIGDVCLRAPALRVCADGAAEGEPCDAFRTPCQSGLRCSDGGVCVARSAVAGPCSRSPDCIDGLLCVAGACAAPGNLGEPCLAGAEAPCAEGLGCNLRLNRCVAGGGDGLPCFDNGSLGRNCAAGFFCNEESEGPVCRAQGVADAPCTDDSMCAEPFYCALGLNVCTPRAADGEVCGGGIGCELGLVCEDRGLGDRCAPPPAAGEPCVEACAGEQVCTGYFGRCEPSACILP